MNALRRAAEAMFPTETRLDNTLELLSVAGVQVNVFALSMGVKDDEIALALREVASAAYVVTQQPSGCLFGRLLEVNGAKRVPGSDAARLSPPGWRDSPGTGDQGSAGVSCRSAT